MAVLTGEIEALDERINQTIKDSPFWRAQEDLPRSVLGAGIRPVRPVPPRPHRLRHHHSATK